MFSMDVVLDPFHSATQETEEDRAMNLRLILSADISRTVIATYRE